MLVFLMLMALQVSTTHPQCTSQSCGEGMGCMELDAGRTQCDHNVDALRNNLRDLKADLENNRENLREDLKEDLHANLEQRMAELTENLAKLAANVSRLIKGPTTVADTYNDCRDAFQDGNFRIGNRLLHILTSVGPQELRIDLQAFDGNTAWAKYSHFSVNDEVNKFRLNISGYTGSDNILGDSMWQHNGRAFSTIDRDNDGSFRHCAAQPDAGGGGGWWYWACRYANLNGQYGQDAGGGGIIWFHWLGRAPLKGSRMMIRPRT